MSADHDLDRISPTLAPTDKPVGWQNWRTLAFIHWRVPVAQIRPLIPPELALDTWGGEAWVAVVPFAMERVRPWWSPPIPGVSWFLETNVRTYVHYKGVPGVWFMSLEATNTIAVLAARAGWSLPYFRSTLSLRRDGDALSFTGRRRWPGPAGAGYDISANLGPLIRQTGTPGHAAPGTLEHFLAERYYLYTVDRRGRLLRGRVHHTPYPLREARIEQWSDSLLASHGIVPTGDPCHVAFSEGVDVAIHGLVRV
jgi:uncharacterized protein YqjF (DUF2071 family)